MSIVARTALFAVAGVSGSSWPTDAATFTANRLQIVDVLNYCAAGGANTPTITGASRTWVQEATVAVTLGATNDLRLTRFRSIAATTDAGQNLTVDFAGQSQASIGAYGDEYSNVGLGGTNGSGAIRQTTSATSTGGAATSISVTYSLTPYLANVLASIVVDGNGATITPRSGWAEINEGGNGFESQWRSDGNDTAASGSWSGGSKALIIASEINARVSDVPGWPRGSRLPMSLLAQ